MSGIGPSVCPVTGLPEETDELERQRRQKKKIGKIMARRDELLNDLSGNGGAVLKALAARMADRINELVAQDPEANALREIMIQFTHEINYGNKLAESLIQGINVEQAAP